TRPSPSSCRQGRARSGSVGSLPAVAAPVRLMSASGRMRSPSAARDGESRRPMDRREPRSGKADGPLEVAPFRCEPVADAEPQALGLTYWFDAAPQGEPY